MVSVSDHVMKCRVLIHLPGYVVGLQERKMAVSLGRALQAKGSDNTTRRPMNGENALFKYMQQSNSDPCIEVELGPQDHITR